MCSKATEAHLGGQTKGQESQPSVQDELGGAKTHDDGHPPCSNLWTHCTRSGHRSGQRDVQELSKNGHGDGQNPSLRNVHSRMVFRSKECRKLLPESNKSPSGSRCARVSMSTHDAEFVKSRGKKALNFGQRPPTLEPSYRSNLCHHLLGVGGWLEAEHTRFLANARRQCHSGRRFVRCRSSTVSPVIWKCNMEKCGWAFAQCGYGERYHHRFCQEGQVSADQGGKFHGCTCAGFSCLRSHQRPSLALPMALFPTNFSVCVATREPWPPGNTNCGNVPATA